LTLQGQRKFGDAISEYEAALKLDANHGLAKNNLAWLLATCPEGSLRNGPRAVELALESQKQSGEGQPDVLDTLAAAYAEAGRFPEATATAKRALELAEAQNNIVLVEHLRGRVKLYEEGTAYREK
jgi:Flp pilus assembly protein TadD